jgi:hypothetical protein
VRAYALIDALSKLRDTDEQAKWERRTDVLLRRLNQARPAGAGGVPAAPLRPRSIAVMFGFVGTAARRRTCGALAQRVVQLIVDACPLVRQIAVRSGDPTTALRAHERAQPPALLALANYLAPAQRAGSVSQTLYNLMQLEIVEFAFNDHDALGMDAAIELVQISGNASSPLNGPTVAKDKLLGLRVAHFGSFYKQSWRANDWTYGRLDGAERLVRILLNTERLHRFYYQRASCAVARITQIALMSIGSRPLLTEIDKLWKERDYRTRLREELAFLDRIAAPLPDALPCCVEVLTMRLHYGVLADELPALLTAISADQAHGADRYGAGAALLRELGPRNDGEGITTRLFSPAQARLGLQRGLIAGETFPELAGSDLFTRTLAHTSATLQNLLASKAARLGPLSALFATLKLPIVGFYLVAQGLTHRSRTSAALHGGLLAAGVALVALYLAAPSGPASSPWVATLGWAMLAYGLVFTVLRGPLTVAVVVALSFFALTLAFKLSVVVAVAAAIVLILSSVRYAWLQTVTALLVVAGLAAASTGLLDRAPLSKAELMLTIGWLAGLIGAVLLVAMWQATPWAVLVEQQLRLAVNFCKRMGQCVRCRMAGKP